MTADKPLIFDIGAHNGDDTHVYLSIGYRVVAVEANPYLIIAIHKRFVKEIANSKLIVCHAAIYHNDNELVPFFILPDSSKSTLQNASYNEEVTIPTIRLCTLIDRFELPHYCKIDIENADTIALASLQSTQVPPYISVEICGRSIGYLGLHPSALFKTLEQLIGLGYKSSN